MPKVKTKSSAKKRFKKVGGKTVKIKRARAYRRHLLTKKSSGRKRKLRAKAFMHAADIPSIIKLLPY